MQVLIRIGFVLCGWILAGQVQAADFEDRLDAVQHGWAKAYYQVPAAGKRSAFEHLAGQAHQFADAYPDRAEPRVWEAIVLSSAARFQGGLGALRKIKQARELLLAAERIDATTLDGSVYTSLGSLYAKSPGWPIAFGDKDKAAEYLRRALAINPQGIDPNFFYGELLLEQGDVSGAKRHFQAALAASPRPGREDADSGRRMEVQDALRQLPPD